jgi:predicted HicB family RNase H-like nuclease
MSRPRASEQLHVRIPPAEKQALREEARQHGVSMSALIRINNHTAQRARALQLVYPQSDV